MSSQEQVSACYPPHGAALAKRRMAISRANTRNLYELLHFYHNAALLARPIGIGFRQVAERREQRFEPLFVGLPLAHPITVDRTAHLLR